jgi:outer membrane protein assembly factor BamB
LAISQANGEVIWRVNLGSNSQTDRHLQNGTIGYAVGYFFVATKADTLLKVNAQGVVVEERRIAPPIGENTPSSRSDGYFEGIFAVVAQGDAVYIGAFLSGTQFLQACSAESLAERWSVVFGNVDTPGDLYLAGETLLCTAPGQLYCIRRDAGEIAWIESDPEKSLSANIYAINESYFIADTVTNGLTVRGLNDGVVLTTYPELDHKRARGAVFVDDQIAIGYSNGVLCIVKNSAVRD